MKVFHHLVYEYQKGLRDLCLFTCSGTFLSEIAKRLNGFGIKYHVCHLAECKINVFFGMDECIEIIKQFSSENLNHLTDEEDFILGMMLGYAKAQQYHRFLRRKLICA